MSVQIQQLFGFQQYVRDLERTRRFYVERLGFVELGRSSEQWEHEARQRSVAFCAGSIFIICSSPLGEGGEAARYLSQHPDGVSAIIFEVQDIRAAFSQLEHRGATPTSEVQTFRDARGVLETFSITTPLGDTLFQFVERQAPSQLLPGIAPYDLVRGAHQPQVFTGVDHVTVNLRTLKPTLLWLEHVLEFQLFWGVEFHTSSAFGEATEGSGLRSQVMWHPSTGIKIACNEPLRPSFQRSQISLFCDDNRGDGIQHVALGVRDIVSTVRALKARGVELMPAPAAYHANLQQHLRHLGIDRIDEDLSVLRDLGILVDGSGPAAYLLQIFSKDAASMLDSSDAGPFFFELIQRKGDAGFGEGNFRALFDSVEGQQIARTG